MKFTVTVGELARALGLVGGVVSSKTTIPILTHVLVKALSDNRISITGTDLERECTSEAPAEIAEPGVEVLQGSVFKTIVNALPKAASLTVSTDGSGRALLTSSRGRYKLATLDAADFPEAKPAEGAPFKVDAKKLRAILEATLGSVSTESTRFYLCGIYLHIADGALVAASTDGHRLCRRSMDLPAGAEGIPGVIIPTMGATTMIALLDGIDGDVTAWITPARMWIRTPQAEFSTALINGRYPDYQRVIPEYNGAAATISGAELCAAVERAAATMPEAKVVSAGLTSTADGLVIKVGPQDAEAAVEQVDAEFHAEGGEVAANSRYLAAMTKVWGDAPIEIHMSSQSDPLVFTSKAIPEQLYILMPMRR